MIQHRRCGKSRVLWLSSQDGIPTGPIWRLYHRTFFFFAKVALKMGGYNVSFVPMCCPSNHVALKSTQHYDLNRVSTLLSTSGKASFSLFACGLSVKGEISRMRTQDPSLVSQSTDGEDMKDSCRIDFSVIINLV